MFFVLQCGSEKRTAWLFFLIMKSRVLNIKKNKKKAICYGILVLWYIDAIIFKKEKVIRVFQMKNIWVHLRKNHFYGCPAFFVLLLLWWCLNRHKYKPTYWPFIVAIIQQIMKRNVHNKNRWKRSLFIASP